MTGLLKGRGGGEDKVKGPATRGLTDIREARRMGGPSPPHRGALRDG